MTEARPAFASPEEALDWLVGEVDDPCIDNLRFAFEDDEAMADYEDRRANGCCGHDDREVLVDGRPAMVGCNYGH